MRSWSRAGRRRGDAAPVVVVAQHGQGSEQLRQAPAEVAGVDVVLVTRSGCHLCEQAEPVVRRISGEAGASLRLLDVDDDQDLRERYTNHVPVLFVFGQLLDYWAVDEHRLAAALRGEPQTPPAAL